MRGWKKAAALGLLLLGALLAIGISLTIGWRPFIGPRARPLTDRTFERTPQRLERGRYLVETGAVACVHCHSELTIAPDGRLRVVEEMRLAGRNWARDGVPFVTAPNLTPDPETGAGRWTDDQLARAIREGIGHDGRAQFPIMPYEAMRHLTDEDLASIVVYLRAQRPIVHALPPSQIPFPINRLINGVPQPVIGPVTADLSTPAKRGEYLVTIAACGDCHTPLDAQGTRLAHLAFAGGWTPHFDGLKDAAAANITPAVDGIPYYTEDLFIEVMRTGRVRDRAISSIMPTDFYGKMTDEDLKAMFAYLQTLPPIEHYVDNALEPTACARCGLSHGGGQRNR